MHLRPLWQIPVVEERSSSTPPNQVKLLTSGPECWRGGRIVGICAAVERSGRVNPAVAGTRVSHTSHVI